MESDALKLNEAQSGTGRQGESKKNDAHKKERVKEDGKVLEMVKAKKDV